MSFIGQRKTCCDSCQLAITWMSKSKDVAMVLMLLYYFSRYWHTDVRTYRELRNNHFFLKRSVTWLKYEARTPSAPGAPLKLFNTLYNVDLAFTSMTKHWSVTIQYKTIEQCSHMLPFDMLYRVANTFIYLLLIFTSVNKTL